MNFESLSQTLPVMVKGMAGIFRVTLVIVLVMVLLNKLTRSK